MSAGGHYGATHMARGTVLAIQPENLRVIVGLPKVGSAIEYLPELQSDPNNFRTNNIVRGVLGPSVGGHYNITYSVRDTTGSKTLGYGYAEYSRGVKYVARNDAQSLVPGTVYHFTAVPAIESVSHNAGGLMGGFELTIKGSGFSHAIAENKVVLGRGFSNDGEIDEGTPCTVTFASDSEIRCIPQPAATTSPQQPNGIARFSAGTGLRRRIWYKSSSPCAGGGCHTKAFDKMGWGSPNIDVIDTDSARSYHFNDGSNYGEQLDGFFVPPVSANYSFYVNSDDYGGIFISPDEDPDNAVAVAHALVYQSFWFQEYETVISQPVYMEKGKRYAFRMQHQESTGNDHFEVAMRIHINDEVRALYNNPNQVVFASTPSVQIIETSRDVVFEVQEIEVLNTRRGRFFMGMQGVAAQLKPVEHNATDSQIKATLNELYPYCNNKFVLETSRDIDASTGKYDVRIKVTFQCPYAPNSGANTHPLITISPQTGRVNATQEITARSVRTVSPSKPLDGTYRIQLGDILSNPVDITSSPSQLRSALLVSFPELIDVEVNYRVPNHVRDSARYYIVVHNPPAFDKKFIPLYNVEGNPDVVEFITGTNAKIEHKVLIDGGEDPFFWNIPAWQFFQNSYRAPTVQVITNGIPSACLGSHKFDFAANPDSSAPCSFVYQEALTPIISSIDDSNAPLYVLTGDRFPTAADGEGNGDFGADMSITEICYVVLGGKRFDIASLDETEITFEAEEGPGGTHPVELYCAFGRGRAQYADDEDIPTVTIETEVDSVSPMVGSIGGGTILTILGNGFIINPENSMTITLGDDECEILSVTYSEISCRTPAQTGHSDITVPVNVNGVDSSVTYTFAAANTPLIESVSPSSLSAATSGVVTLTFADWTGASLSADDIVIKVAGRECQLNSVDESDKVIKCTLLRGNPGPFQGQAVVPQVYFNNLGYAHPAQLSDPTIDCSYYVSQISPQVGSLMGDIPITITGMGLQQIESRYTVNFLFHQDVEYFDEDLEEMVSVYTSNYVPCTVTGVAEDASSITCTLQAPPAYYNGETATLVMTMNGISAPCETPAVCEFVFAQENTGSVTSYSVDVDKTDPVFPVTTYTFVGSNFAEPISVYFGAERVPDDLVALEGEGTKLVVTVPPQAAGIVPIRIRNDVYGGFRFATGAGNTHVELKHTFPLHIHAATIPQYVGSVAGGLKITLRGHGFASVLLPNSGFTVVRFEPVSGTKTPREARVLDVTPQNITFMAPFLTENSPESLNIRVIVYTDSSKTTERANVLLTGKYKSVLDGSSPKISAISQENIEPGMSLTLTGSNFGTYSPEMFISVGNELCVIDENSFSNTSVTCTVGDVPAGTHKVRLYVPGAGFAQQGSSLQVTAALVLTEPSVNPYSCGSGGGCTLELLGSGFGSPESESTVDVLVCNSKCRVTERNIGSLNCVVDPIVTPQSLDMFGDDENILTGKSLGPATNNPAASAMDGDITTGYKGACRIGIVMDPNSLALLSRVRWYPTFQKANAFRNAKIQVTTSPVTDESQIQWETVATLGPVKSLTDGPVNYQDRDPAQFLVEGWNYYDIPTDLELWSQRAKYTAVSILHDHIHGECVGQEVQFIGHTITSSSDASCPIEVSVTPKRDYVALTAPATTTKRNENAFQVLADITPHITGLTTLGNPIAEGTGTALGGTAVVITGTQFSHNMSDVTVVLNGVPCVVQTTSEIEIQCITGPRDEIRPHSVNVNIKGKGKAIFNPYKVRPFRYLDLWSALTTWGVTQELPVEGDSVVIPRGQAVLMDISPPRLFMVLVQGELVFGKVDGLALNATYIMAHGGRIEAGTEQKPHEHTLTITLHGDRWTTVEVMGYGAKVLGIMNARVHDHDKRDTIIQTTDIYNTGYEVMNMEDEHMPGTMGLPTRASVQAALELHGKPRKRVWTKVQPGNYPAGTKLLRLSEPVDWVHGEKIVVAPSSFAGFAEAEEHVVDRVENEIDVYLMEPLRHARTSTLYDSSATGHGIVDMRFEVGLLSRNIVVQGDDKSPEQLFGAHTIAVLGGTYRIENIELRYCGQAGNLGRYCTHTHMTGSQAHVRSYVRANSIHHSFQRANTIHATNYMRVSDNVAYHVRGHTYFIEDGNEIENVVEGNLAVLTLRNFAGLDGDKRPASFWAASPSNHWRNNVAAGSINDGYWLELPHNPHGPSYTPTICPIGGPLGSFQNNTAHSNGVHGLRIYPTYTPYVDPCNPESGSSPQYFHDFTSFRNGDNGIFGKQNGDLHHIRPKLLENGQEEFHHVKYIGSIKYTEDPNVVDALMVNTIDPINNPPSKKIGLWTPQDEFYYLKGVHFVNYHPSVGALSLCSHCATDIERKQGGYTVRVEGMHFYNTVKKVEWTGHFNDIILDLDGSFTNHGAFSTLTPYKAYNEWNECSVLPKQTYDYSIVCPREYPIRRLQLYKAEPSVFDMLNLNITALDMPDHTRTQWLAQNPTTTVKVQDLVDSDRLDIIKFQPKEFAGWTIPVVSKKWYDVKVRSLSDWRKVTYRYSEPAYIANYPDQGEYLGVVMRHTDFRYRNRVEYKGNATLKVDHVQELDQLPSPVRDPFGAGSFFSVPEDFLRPVTEQDKSSKRWALLFNTQNPAPFDPINFEDTDSLSLVASNIQCPPFGCYVPPPPQRGEYTLWSDPASWEDGIVPLMYDDVVIPPHRAIIMDIDPPLLGSLTVEGAFKILDRDAKLEVYRIVIWGEMFVGTPDLPFNSNLEIILHGQRDDPATVVDNNLFLGNKNIVVLGELHIHGAPKTVTWTKLATTAAAGSTTIELSVAVNEQWKVGDAIVLSATEFDLPIQSEVAVISSISGGGKTLTLSKPLRYTHYAGPAMLPGTVTNSRTTSKIIAAGVGLLTRNVVIRPDFLTMANGEPNGTDKTYGFHIVVAAIHRLKENAPPQPTESDWITRVGFINARYVEFRGGGKGEMEYPVVNVQYGSYIFDPLTTPTASRSLPADLHGNNNLIGNSFSHSFNSGFSSYSSNKIVLQDNVFHDNRRFAIEFDANSEEGVIERNFISGVYQSPEINAPDTTLWVSPVSGIYLHSNKIKSLKGNLVTGSVDTGIALRAAVCPADYSARKIANKSNLHQSYMSDNEVHSTLVGVFFLGTRTQCALFNGFTVWKAAHIGLVAVDAIAPKFIVSDVAVIDAHIGLSLNFANLDIPKVAVSEVTHSLFIGVATAAAAVSKPEASLYHRAMTIDDPTGTSIGGSVMGLTYARTGIIGSQYTNRAKTGEFDNAVLKRPPNRPERLCGLPWEKRFGLPSTRGTHMFLTDIVFAGYVEDYQGLKTTAYSLNPTQVDQPVPVSMSKIIWDNVPLKARFNFRTPDDVDTACGGDCDGMNFALVSDVDGTVTGTANTSIVPNNPALVDQYACTYVNEWRGYYCPGIKFRQSIIENMDRDRGFRRLGTMHITRVQSAGSVGVNRTIATEAVIDDNCAKRFYFGQHAFLVEANSVNKILLPSTEPEQFRYHFFSPSADEGLVYQVNYYRPNAIQVEHLGVRIPSQIEKLPPQVTVPTLPRINSDHGSNQFDTHNRTFHLTLRGTDEDYTYAHISAIRLPTVQLNFRLAVSMEEFFGANFAQHLATLLQIEPSRIKIVDVRPGSTIIDLEIYPPANALHGVQEVPNVPDANNTIENDGKGGEYFHLDPSIHSDFYGIVNQMQELVAHIKSLAEAGQLLDIANYSVETIVMTPPLSAPSSPSAIEDYDDLVNDPGIPLSPKPKKKETNIFSVGSIAAITVGAVLGVLIIAVLAVAIKRNALPKKRSGNRRKVHREPPYDPVVHDSSSVGVTIVGGAHGQPALYGDGVAHKGATPLAGGTPHGGSIEVSDTRLKFTPKLQKSAPRPGQMGGGPMYNVAPSYGPARIGARIT